MVRCPRPRLGRATGRMAADVDQCLGNGNGAPQRVDPLGPQPEEFTGPQPAEGGQEQGRLVAGIDGTGQDTITSVSSRNRVSVRSMLRGSAAVPGN